MLRKLVVEVGSRLGVIEILVAPWLLRFWRHLSFCPFAYVGCLMI